LVRPSEKANLTDERSLRPCETAEPTGQGVAWRASQSLQSDMGGRHEVRCLPKWATRTRAPTARQLVADRDDHPCGPTAARQLPSVDMTTQDLRLQQRRLHRILNANGGSRCCLCNPRSAAGRLSGREVFGEQAGSLPSAASMKMPPVCRRQRTKPKWHRNSQKPKDRRGAWSERRSWDFGWHRAWRELPNIRGPAWNTAVRLCSRFEASSSRRSHGQGQCDRGAKTSRILHDSFQQPVSLRSNRCGSATSFSLGPRWRFWRKPATCSSSWHLRRSRTRMSMRKRSMGWWSCWERSAPSAP